MAISAVEKFKHVLYDDTDGLKDRFTEKEIKQLLRIRFAHSKLLENPLIVKKTLVDLIVAMDSVSTAQGYYDVELAETMLGDIKNASRQYMLFVVTEGAKKAYEIAEKNKDAKAMAAAMNIIAKYHRLDQPESEELPFDKIVPPSFIITSDIKVIRPDYSENSEDLRFKVLKRTAPDLIEDAEIIP